MTPIEDQPAVPSSQDGAGPGETGMYQPTERERINDYHEALYSGSKTEAADCLLAILHPPLLSLTDEEATAALQEACESCYSGVERREGKAFINLDNEDLDLAKLRAIVAIMERVK